MTTKTLIIDDLGEQALLLPQKLQDALAANDRLKLYFSLLQAAESHADHAQEPPPDLRTELRAAGVESEFDLTIANSRREPDGSLSIPGAARLRQLIDADIAAMSAPLALAGTSTAEAFAIRERAVMAGLPEFTSDRVPKGAIGAMTTASRSSNPASDSLHLLVMDLHKAINAVAGNLAQESIDGARVWNIDAADGVLIRAFMSGLNETAPLKFDHPGLGTTATRAGSRLIIQNDIGTTDAHVLVLHVEGLTATMTYTDVHAGRLAFFQSLFKPFPVQWTDSSTRRNEKLSEEPDYSLSVARLQAADTHALERYLAFLGSRLVFLIDWNRARKRLQEFVPKKDAVRLLKWAADNKIGQRGFLQLGGERMLYDAIEFAQPTPLRYGERLHESLGAEAAFDYLQFVFTAATTGLLEGRSERFIRDEIKAELARRFRTSNASLLTIALAHAERVFDLATAVHDGLLCHGEPQAPQLLERTARRARQWEQECDAIVSRVRSLARRTSKPEAYAGLLHEADDAADGLEEASFLMTHLAVVAPPRKLMEPVQTLAALLVAGAQESVKTFAAASHVTREGEREDLQDFFAAVDRVVAIEHETDTAERAIISALLTDGADVRTFQLLWSIAQVLEQAADGLSLSALKLRDHLLNEVITG
jgi:uncharacterized protein Yka (UPF0111/DUF47 family)